MIERGNRMSFRPGINCLRHLLEKRQDGLTLDEVFEPESLNFPLAYCGDTFTKDVNSNLTQVAI
ncbi:MAG: hypothetical protein IT210_06640 [Armatimonadetes bacterium]|nr:hypothetical protein [Armatimonadota bacterium]